MPIKPTTQAKIATLMKRQAILDGALDAPLPEVGKRISLRPERVRAIRILAREGWSAAEIAAAMDTSRSLIRRYAREYNIDLPKGSPGGPGKRIVDIQTRQQRVVEMLRAGCTMVEMSKRLGVSVYTINKDVQYVRAKYGIDTRSQSKTRRNPAT